MWICRYSNNSCQSKRKHCKALDKEVGQNNLEFLPKNTDVARVQPSTSYKPLKTMKWVKDKSQVLGQSLAEQRGKVQVYTHEDNPANSKLSNWGEQKYEEKGRMIKIEWKIRCKTTVEMKERREEKKDGVERVCEREEDGKKGARIPKGDRPSRAPDPILSPAKCIISREKEYEVISACRGCSRQAVYLAAYSTCKTNVKAKISLL